MLRTILALLIVISIGSLGYYIGRSAASTEVPLKMTSYAAPPLPVAAEKSRAGTEEPAALPPPPPVTPGTDLSSPVLPDSVGLPVQAEAAPLADRVLGLPILGLKAASIQDTFNQARGGGGERKHEATDILSARGTPVLAVDSGPIVKLFTSKPGGLTVYQFDPQQNYAYYYAHLDRYAEGIKEGGLVKKGDMIGYVGTTGNADPNTPHLHFAIFQLGPEKRWWEGKAINPYPLLMRAVGR